MTEADYEEVRKERVRVHLSEGRPLGSAEALATAEIVKLREKCGE